MRYAHRVRFERLGLSHLGGVGIDLASGTQDVAVVESTLRDIGSSGIQAGEVLDGAQNALPVDQLDRIEVSNVRIERAGAEFADAVGIGITYASNVSLLHDELHDLPYSGISIGWGWGTDSYARNIVVAGCYIEGVVQTLQDGGGIYTLSPLPRSVIERNVIVNQPNRSGAIFLDEGTAYVTVADNVIEDVDRWLHIWTDSIHDNVVVDNVTTSAEHLDAGIDNVVRDNIEGVEAWPPNAEVVIDDAGRQTG